MDIDGAINTIGEKLSGMGKPLIRRKLERKIKDKIEQVPVAQIRELVENEAKPQFLIQMFGGDEQEVIAEAQAKYAWIGQMFSDDELIRMLPKWCLVVLQEYGEDGEAWIRRELAHTRKMLFQQEGNNGSQQRVRPVGRPDDQRGASADPPVQTFVYRRRIPISTPEAAQRGGDRPDGVPGDHPAVQGGRQAAPPGEEGPSPGGVEEDE